MQQLVAMRSWSGCSRVFMAENKFGNAEPKLFMGPPIHTPITRFIDFLSIVSNFLLIIGFPIAAHYFSGPSSDAEGKMATLAKLMVANAILSFLGIMWLLFRYGIALAKRYPFVANPKYRTRISLSFLFLYWLGYEILKNTIWVA